MNLYLDVQRALDAGPGSEDVRRWAEAALRYEQQDNVELSVRIVDEVESASLNYQYRGKDYATNVLSFGCDLPTELEMNLLGDLLICAPVVQREAAEQGKTEQAHWAHMIVHGVLHLLGFDHLNEDDAQKMEQHEIAILQKLGFANPYLQQEA